MKLSFRWYGEDDKVTLEQIRQIPGMYSIVTAVYDVPVGEVWSVDSIARLKTLVEQAGLAFEVIESVPVHEDIKLGKPTRDRYIENYCENIRRLSKAGVKCICYNFMPVFDWTRTQLDHVLPDGSTTLVYYQEQVERVNPLESESDLTLPGWDSSYTREELKEVVAQYQALSEDDLWNNLEYFLKAIIPVAKECDVNMAIHEDDPCWSIFGLPRIITCEENLDRFLKLVDDSHNGITLCTGSLGCSCKNNVVHMAAKYAKMGRIHFVHMRNVAVLENGFEERAHLSNCGSLDMFEIMKALKENGFIGYIRPDHGRMIWGETGRAGYGLYDRALGATYLNGLWEALEKKKQVPFGTDLSGKVAVVTGAGGILCGMFAKTLAKAGAKVAVLDLNEEAAREVASEIMQAGGIAKAYQANVLEKASLQKVHEKVKVELGFCDILINGAGGNHAKANTTKEYFEKGDLDSDTVSFFDLDQDGVEFVFRLNFIGTLLPSQVFAEDMVGKEGCTIINISSMNAYTPLTKIPAYSGAKAAISNFTQWLAVHFSKVGIRVNAMAPGFFVTKQNEKLLFHEDGTETPRTQKILAATPMERFGKAEELNGTLLYLCNEEASGFVNGVIIPIDGGFSAYSGV